MKIVSLNSEVLPIIRVISIDNLEMPWTAIVGRRVVLWWYWGRCSSLATGAGSKVVSSVSTHLMVAKGVLSPSDTWRSVTWSGWL